VIVHLGLSVENVFARRNAAGICRIGREVHHGEEEIDPIRLWIFWAAVGGWARS